MERMFKVLAVCNRCGKELEIAATHIGKRHKSCGDRTPGQPRIRGGVWEKKPKPKETELEKES
jgi:hypothetical protein